MVKRPNNNKEHYCCAVRCLRADEGRGRSTHLDELGEVFLEHAGQPRPRGVVALLVAPRLAGVQHLRRNAGYLRRHLEPEDLRDGEKEHPVQSKHDGGQKRIGQVPPKEEHGKQGGGSPQRGCTYCWEICRQAAKKQLGKHFPVPVLWCLPLQSSVSCRASRPSPPPPKKVVSL